MIDVVIGHPVYQVSSSLLGELSAENLSRQAYYSNVNALLLLSPVTLSAQGLPPYNSYSSGKSKTRSGAVLIYQEKHFRSRCESILCKEGMSHMGMVLNEQGEYKKGSHYETFQRMS